MDGGYCSHGVVYMRWKVCTAATGPLSIELNVDTSAHLSVPRMRVVIDRSLINAARLGLLACNGVPVR